MSKSIIGARTLGILYVIAALLTITCTLSAQSKPNIIFILMDDIGYEVPGCNGGRSYATPNIDQMAREGMRFTQCHASPVCSPSRVSLLTGKYNFRNYLEWGKMDQGQKTIANLLKEAGYATLISGKWQLNGGEKSIHKFGFDNYTVWKPYEASSKYYQYKNPLIYEDSAYLPAAATMNKYGEDIFAQKVFDFIDSNKAKPFFIFYPMVLCHKGFSPTPDDPEFAMWDPSKKREAKDSVFFPSMVKYMDKKIGEVINKIKSVNLQNNTIIILTGDNGSPSDINSLAEDGELIRGGKSATTEYGTHVPLIISWKGKITEGSINTSLVDFTDFMPTLGHVANTAVPVTFGPVDGVDFSAVFTSQPTTPRNWIFNHFKPYPYNGLNRWAQTATYKLYNSEAGIFFYNIIADVYEQHPIPNALLTAGELLVKQQLQAVIDGYAAQSPPFLQNLTASNISDTSVQIGATITTKGSISSVNTRGTLIGLNKDLGSQDGRLVDTGTSIGAFTQLRTQLQPEKLYYYNAFATNNNGVGVGLGKASQFRTLSQRVEAQPSFFNVKAKTSGVSVSWNNAAFPAAGATQAGYLLLFSTGLPLLKDLPNGHPPNNAVKTGITVPTATTTLPSLPKISAERSGLHSNTTYHFLLVPYTWNGKDTASYNYLVANANTAEVTTLIPAEMEISVYPNPAPSGFTLVVNSPDNSDVQIRATDISGRSIYKTAGPGNQYYYMGRNFPSGLYLVEVMQGEKTKKVKVVIAK